MKFSSVSDDFFGLCSFDKELLYNENEKRPYLIILRLKYRGTKHDFAILFRSNISNYIPKNQYFSLPPRHTTKKEKIHGLHYIKMFPITKKYLIKFNKDKDRYYQLLDSIINKNIKQIIQEAQDHLINYENGVRLDYSTNIDRIYCALYGLNSLEEVAVAKE